MNLFLSQAEFYDLPIRISQELQENPMAALQEFYSFYPLSEIRQSLWDLLETALTSRNLVFAESEKREEIVLFYEQLEKMLEGAYILYKKESPMLNRKAESTGH
jgi:hypothetical protein